MVEHGHIPVLLEECLDLLALQPGMVAVDGTLGRGGHASAIIPKMTGGMLVGLDLDPHNLAYSQQRLTPIAAAHDVTLHFKNQSFSQLSSLLDQLELPEKPQAILADLGFASNQVEAGDRGLSFKEDGPLDMRLDASASATGITAAQLIAQLPEADLADLIFGFGEERLSRRIAKKIVEARKKQPITTTSALADLVRRAYGPAAGRQRIHPATRTFMALRIAVNDELGALERLLAQLPTTLGPGGRAAIISFHSLEDRRVKFAFRELAKQDHWQLITRKPITAQRNEAEDNPRSRSAKLRVIERCLEP